MPQGKKRYYGYILFLLPLLLVGSACNITRSIPDHEYLLNKNIIKTDKPEYNEQLMAIIKQKPNKKIQATFER